MAYMDIFQGEGFNLVDHLEAINLLPNMYDRITRRGIFSPRPVRSNTFPVEMRQNELALVPISPWGTDEYAFGHVDDRQMNAVRIPHMSIIDQMLADQVDGQREFGTVDQYMSFATELTRKQQAMKNSIDQTMEWRYLGALKGKVLDADAVKVIFDPFDFFGVTRKKFNLGLVDASGVVQADTDVLQIIRDIKRYYETHGYGERITGIRCMISPYFFDKLIAHPKVEKFWVNHAAALDLALQDKRLNFPLEGVIFEEYNASVPKQPDNSMQPFFTQFEGLAYPEGTLNTFVEAFAPARTKTYVNTPGQPFYSWSREKDWDLGTEVKVERNSLPICLRPGLAVELDARVA